MVINTNTEVYSKAARLISPLYKIDAEKICFEFYYHMYGISVGTLRVYARPESVDMQDALVSDEATEVMNDYVIFEIKGMCIVGLMIMIKFHGIIKNSQFIYFP